MSAFNSLVSEQVTGRFYPFALTLRQAQWSKGIHRKKLGFDRLTPNGF
jgi:hypothetical protein